MAYRMRAASSMRRTVALAALALSASPSYAWDLDLMVKAGWETGRSKLAYIPIQGGPSQEIMVNDGQYIGGGLAYLNDAKDIEAELSMNYKIKIVTADNGSVSWSRVPIDAMLFYRTTKYRFGVGGTYHMRNRLVGTGGAQPLAVYFERAPGLLAQADYRVSERVQVGVRVIKLTYKTGGQSYSSDGGGITISGAF